MAREPSSFFYRCSNTYEIITGTSENRRRAASQRGEFINQREIAVQAFPVQVQRRRGPVDCRSQGQARGKPSLEQRGQPLRGGL